MFSAGCGGASNGGTASAPTTASPATVASAAPVETPCSGSDSAAAPATLTQFGSLAQLERGAFDGPTTIGELLKGGDFGLGTYNALAGEMIVLDGNVYLAPADGVIQVPNPSEHIPFAAVTRFRPDRRVALRVPVSGYPALQTLVTNLIPDSSRLLALKVHATFSSIKVRTPRKQTPPYPSLADAAKTQVERTFTNIQGTLVGFRLPAYIGSTNQPGFHFHFISDDHTKGGHLLELSIDSGTVEVQNLDRIDATVSPHGG